MGGLTLNTNTLYADICYFKPYFSSYIAMVSKGLNLNQTGTGLFLPVYWRCMPIKHFLEAIALNERKRK